MSYKNTVTVIIGFAGSGKSTLVDQITSKMNFESGYLFSRENAYDVESLEKIMEKQQLADAKDTLVVLDCPDTRIFKSNVLKKLIYRARHLKITLIITTFNAKSLSYESRENAKNLIFMGHEPLVNYVQNPSNNFTKSYARTIALSYNWLKLPFAYCRMTNRKLYDSLYDDEPVTHLFDKSQYEGKVTIVVGRSGSGKTTILDKIKQNLNTVSYTFDHKSKSVENLLEIIVEEQSRLVLSNNLEAKVNAITDLFSRLIVPGCVIYAKDKVKSACVVKNSVYLSNLSDLSDNERIALGSITYGTQPIKNITIVLDDVDSNVFESDIFNRIVVNANRLHINLLVSMQNVKSYRELSCDPYNVIVTDEQSLRTLVNGESYGNYDALSVKKSFEKPFSFIRFCATTTMLGL